MRVFIKRGYSERDKKYYCSECGREINDESEMCIVLDEIKGLRVRRIVCIDCIVMRIRGVKGIYISKEALEKIVELKKKLYGDLV